LSVVYLRNIRFDRTSLIKSATSVPEKKIKPESVIRVGKYITQFQHSLIGLYACVLFAQTM